MGGDEVGPAHPASLTPEELAKQEERRRFDAEVERLLRERQLRISRAEGKKGNPAFNK
jgi:hypothetical protein